MWTVGTECSALHSNEPRPQSLAEFVLLISRITFQLYAQDRYIYMHVSVNVMFLLLYLGVNRSLAEPDDVALTP
jgi:hypothetical protein